MKKNVFLNSIDFSPGIVEYEDFPVQKGIPLSEQIDILKEDLLQVMFYGTKRLVIDLGWYPSFEKKGKFQIRVVEESNWEKFSFYAETDNLEKLHTLLYQAVRYCQKQQA